MKYIKLFEKLKILPETGDYVIATTYRPGSKSDTAPDYDMLKIFLETHIGKIDVWSTQYRIWYDEEFFIWQDGWQEKRWSNCYWADKNEILHCSKDPEELKIFIEENKIKHDVEKYNL
jgi:hypothetical protein